MNKGSSFRDFVAKERDFERVPYAKEQDFYACVADGNLPRTRELCQQAFTELPGLGRLSEDLLRHFRYHLIITAAMLARKCIAGGLEVSKAYGLSDYYINQADLARTKEELNEIHTQMCMTYAREMKVVRKRPVRSRHVAAAVDYIYEHLNERIRLADLAAHTGVSGEHLSRSFHQEMGVSITEYVLAKKLETAVNMLQNTDWTAAEIAAMLAFSNQSYFTKQFRERFGVTPGEYRQRAEARRDRSRGPL